MELDVSSIKRALFDLFKFNPKDFYVRGSPTGYTIGLNSRTVSSSGGGGSVNNRVIALQNIASAEQTFDSGVQASAATALASVNAQKVAIDAAVTTSFNTAFAGSVFSPGVLVADPSPFVPFELTASYKRVSLRLNGSNFNATIFERRYENFLFIQDPRTATRFTISYSIIRRTTIGSGIPSNTTLSSGSFNAPLTPIVSTYGIQLMLAKNYPDITAQAWPADPATPTGNFTNTNTVELIFRVTGILP
jgi:hypothetical protein